MNKINEIIDGLIFIKGGTKDISERETINKACDILAKVEHGENDYKKIMAEVKKINTFDRLQEICNAERDGRCVVLPCKVGDTVYHDSGGFGILEYVIDGFAWNETGIIFQAASDSFGVDDVWECLDEIEFYGSDVGKTVFLSRESAEQALKGGAE